MRLAVLVVVAVAPLVGCSKKSEGPAAETNKAAAGSAAPETGSAGSAAAGSAAGSGGATAPGDAKFCFARGADEYASLGRFGGDAKTITVCAVAGDEGAEKTTCGALDRTTWSWAKGTPPPEPPKPPSPLEIKQDKGTVHLCKGEACVQLAGLPAAEEDYRVAVSADGTRAAVGGAALGGFWTYDATTGKKQRAVKLAGVGANEDAGECFHAIAFAGELVYAATDVCAGPGADGAFYSWAGKKVAQVTTNPYGYAPIDLGDGTFAVGDLGGGKLDLVDTKTGKVRPVEIPVEECEDCDLLNSSPDSSAGLAKLPDGKLLQVHARGIAIVDPASAKVEKQVAFPLCGK